MNSLLSLGKSLDYLEMSSEELELEGRLQKRNKKCPLPPHLILLKKYFLSFKQILSNMIWCVTVETEYSSVSKHYWNSKTPEAWGRSKLERQVGRNG